MLTPATRDSLIAFRLRFIANVSRTAYNQFREAFSDRLTLSSEWHLLHEVAALSGVRPEWYERCVNSCLAFIGDYSLLDICPECHEPRYTLAGRARRFFCYIPFTPRLRVLYQSPELVRLMQYRATFDNATDDDDICDVFNSGHYRRLRETRVVVDGETLPHTHFSDPRDIAFGICTDAYLLFQRKRAGPSATPILLQNYNLPPQLRTHLEHLICIGVIGGPKQPKLLHTFLIPFENECAALAHGVETHDSLHCELFVLHAYCIFCLGDIIAIMKLLNLRGVNAMVPCRSCRIRGYLMPGGTNYYVPLIHPHLPGGGTPSAWDPRALPPRTHHNILKALHQISQAKSKGYREKLGRHHGIRCSKTDPFLGPVIGRRVTSSLDFARSFPWDWMHLFCENIIPNLVDLWMGRFKSFPDEGTGSYEIPCAIWVKIAQETVEAVKDIPSAFVSAIPDLIKGRESWTAEIWAFWFMYVAPIVLRNRFQDDKYYVHMCDLITIMDITLQFEITRAELEDLRDRIITWVETYEEFYYQYDATRLPACLLVVHGLLHIVDDIVEAGPIWSTWTFFMERFCGHLKRALRSRTQPWTHLDRRVVNIAHYAHVRAKYDLPELSTPLRADKLPGPSESECVIPGCESSLASLPYLVLVILTDALQDPLSYLRRPCIDTYSPGDDIRRRIAKYMVSIMGRGTRAQFVQALPTIIPAWGKVRIGEGGDAIRAMIGSRARLGTHERNSSFVRVRPSYVHHERCTDFYPVRDS